MTLNKKITFTKLPEIWLSAQLCPSTSVTTAVQLHRSSCNASYFSWRCRRSFHRSDISRFRRIGGAFFFKSKHAANSCVVIVRIIFEAGGHAAELSLFQICASLCTAWGDSARHENRIPIIGRKKLHSQSRTFCKRKRRLVLSYEGGRITCELILSWKELPLTRKHLTEKIFFLHLSVCLNFDWAVANSFLQTGTILKSVAAWFEPNDCD